MRPSLLRSLPLLAALAACDDGHESARRPPHGGGYSEVDGVARTRFKPLGLLAPGARLAVDMPRDNVWSGYEVALSAGATARLRLTLSRGDVDLVLYGPRTPQGLWGAPLAQSNDGDELRYTAARAGVYFALLWPPGRAARGELRFECDGCAPPSCAPPPSCDLFCDEGYAPALGGCLSCACAAPAECEPDCAAGDLCVGGRCMSTCEASCDPRPAPVCGDDGRLYPNGCLAACAAVAVAPRERCDAPRPCLEDDECPLRSACVDRVCRPREEDDDDDDLFDERAPEDP